MNIRAKKRKVWGCGDPLTHVTYHYAHSYTLAYVAHMLAHTHTHSRPRTLAYERSPTHARPHTRTFATTHVAFGVLVRSDRKSIPLCPILVCPGVSDVLQALRSFPCGTDSSALA